MNDPNGRAERVAGYMTGIDALAKQVGDGVVERESQMDADLGLHWQSLADMARELVATLYHDSEAINDVQARALREVLSDALDAIDHRHR